MKNIAIKFLSLANLRCVFAMSVFLISSAFSLAQYESLFGSQSTSWNRKTSQLFGAALDSMWYAKDTLIQGEEYFIVTYGYANILFSEDTTQGTAWYLSVNAVNDTLIEAIYDLSLSLGDTFEGRIVDSVYFINGKKHIRLDWKPNGMEGEKWVLIEGVGTNIGFFFNDIQPVLLCQRKNDTINFMNSHAVYGGQCNLDGTSVGDAPENTNIQIHPNPAGYEVRVLNIKKTSNYTIIDLNGHVVKRGVIEMDGVIKLHGIDRGLYILSIEGNRVKLVVQ